MDQEKTIEPCSVIGLGGLGHMAVKFGVAMGAHVTVISTSESKRDDAMKLGATAFVVSKDPEQLKPLAHTLSFIIDTVSAPHDVGAMMELLDFEGVYCTYVLSTHTLVLFLPRR